MDLNFDVEGRRAESLSRDLIRLRTHESEGGEFTCEATFSNWGSANGRMGFLYFGYQTLDFGKEFAVSVDDTSIFAGQIVALESSFPAGMPPELVVRADAPFQDLRVAPRSRSFLGLSDAQVVEQIATEHGLTAEVNIAGPTHDVLVQVEQSDLAFLRELVRTSNTRLSIEGHRLIVSEHYKGAREVLRIAYPNEIVEFTVQADLTGQCSTLTVTGLDPDGRIVSETADASALSIELGDLEGAADILHSSLADRDDTESHTGVLGHAEARARAQRLFRRTARRFVRGHGVAQTTAELRVGITVQLDGLGPSFCGQYYVGEVDHRFDIGGGMRTEFTVERPGLGRRR